MALDEFTVIGRSEKSIEKYGHMASLFIGKQFNSNKKTFLDISHPHVILICGKRGSGKSYTQSAIIEGISQQTPEIRNEVSSIIFDTMGIFWSLKYSNKNKKELKIMEEWGITPDKIDIINFVPRDLKKISDFDDNSFSFLPSEVSAENWCLTFGLDQNSPLGICITRSVTDLKKEFTEFTLDDLINQIKRDKKSATQTKDALENRLEGVKNWHIFSKEGISVKDLLLPGSINVIDLSGLYYSAQTWNIRSLVVGLLTDKILQLKMMNRKKEQITEVDEEIKETDKLCSQVWFFIDEAHQFVPSGSLTPASWPLKRIIREGRQPGISLVVATQQPGKLDTDIITQSDIVISHNITSKIDLDSLSKITTSYQKKSISFSINNLPKKPGAALIIDDTRESMDTIQVRPKITSHAGESPDILKKIYRVIND